MVTRQQIIAFVVLLLVVSAFGGVYQFYFKQRLEEYSKDQAYLDQLKGKLVALEKTFFKTRPDIVVDQWRGAVQPWVVAVEGRSRYFSPANMYEFEPVPEGKIPKFHYQEQLPRMLEQLQRDANVRGCIIPYTTFGMPTGESLGGHSVLKADVETWLRSVSLGCYMTRLLIDAKATRVNQVEIWPTRVQFDVLEMQTIGFSFEMSLENFVSLAEKMRRDSHYYTFEALRVENPYLRYPYAGGPPLQINMLLTTAKFLPDKSVLSTQPVGGQEIVTAAATGPAGAGARGQMSSSAADQLMKTLAGPSAPAPAAKAPEPPSGFWKNFRR
ncbi:MAG: hypothetical protein HY706_07440 [Candidatus Hydrogenedentes bacterium]|nr:hypothetical protein [Candidatus Hydrogenedentota bacterium]